MGTAKEPLSLWLFYLLYIYLLCIQMIRMIRVLARVSPGDIHLAGGQVNDHGRDGTLTVKWIDTIDVVITYGIRQIDMILLDRLHGLNTVR